jgi:prepilin-type N-terminal cleavage/methylation domain-containing protein
MVKKRSRQAGFTLTEAMVVMAIISIGAVISIPYFRSKIPHYSLRSSARDLVTDLRMAQGLAVKTGTAYQIDFDSVNDLYKIICTRDADSKPAWDPPCEPDPLPHLVTDPANDPPTRLLAKDKGISSVNLVSIKDAIPAALTTIQFAGNGSLSLPAGNFPVTVTLQSNERKTECIQVLISRGGKMQTQVLAPAACSAL